MNLTTKAKTESQGSRRRLKRLCLPVRKQQLADAGAYEKAREAFEELWPQTGETARLESLDQATRAEVLVRIGALAGWLGNAYQATGSQEKAKHLITRSIEIFDQTGESDQLTEARTDLALCYWREGPSMRYDSSWQRS